MFERIVVPVDLTERSLSAVDQAFELATLSRAEVTLLHVIERIEHVTFDEMKEFYRRLENSARKGLEEFSARFEEKSLKVDRVVSFGHRTQTIVDTAIANQADLIIMASHRVDPDRPGHDWATISYGVAVLAPCAVLLVK
jgi:nucleotide-binding universal stress UspA family protein